MRIKRKPMYLQREAFDCIVSLNDLYSIGRQLPSYYADLWLNCPCRRIYIDS